MNILLVDDEPIVHETLRAMLHHLGHSSEWVGDGLAGQRALREKHYHAAFVDIRMPGMDGISLLKWCRNYHPHLPVVIMSGHGADDARDTALMCGALAFLNKPFALQEIKALIEKIQAQY